MSRILASAVRPRTENRSAQSPHGAPAPYGVLPTPDALRKLLADLFGTVVTVTAVPELLLDVAASAIFRSSADESPRAALFADTAFVASAGAALALLPPDVALEAIRARRFSEGISQNFSEVTNIITSLFNALGHGHLRLRECEILPAKAPAEVLDAFRIPVARIDLDVRIQRYAPGRMALLICQPI